MAIPICSHETLGAEQGWLDSGTIWWLTVIGRVPPGGTLDLVNARLMGRSAALFRATLPPTRVGEEAEHYLASRLRAIPGAAGVSALRRRYGNPLLVLFVATALVLLIACTNLANLILARSSAREREFALRLALGASRRRLARQVMIENGLVALCGTIAGLAVAGVFRRSLLGHLGAGVALEAPLDTRLFAFMALIACATSVTVGWIPAWRSSRVAAVEAMKTGDRTLSGRRDSQWRGALVVSQMALSVVLLFGALLFAGTLRNLLAVDPGFQPDGVTIVRVDFSRMQMSEARRSVVTHEALSRVRNIPGVRSAAEVRHVPMGGTGGSITVWRDGADPASRTPVRLNAMSDGYLQTMEIALLAGRDFSARDTALSSKVAIVNHTLARRLGISGNPVGERFHATEGADADVYEIVGLVPDTKYFSLREDALPIAFVPITQIEDPRPFTDILLRSTGPLTDLSNVRRAVAGISPLIGTDLRDFESTIHDALRRERLMAALAAFFGILAALIATVGLYGLLSFLVAQRTNEIGIRMALGARRTEVMRMVIRHGGLLVGGGVAIGAVLAFAVAGFTQALVFGLPPHDFATLALACVLLATVAVPAAVLPAVRASRLDPLTALREH